MRIAFAYLSRSNSAFLISDKTVDESNALLCKKIEAGQGATKITKKTACFYRSQLVFIAQQNKACIRSYSLEQFCKQGNVDHRTFINDYHIIVKRIIAVNFELKF